MTTLVPGILSRDRLEEYESIITKVALFAVTGTVLKKASDKTTQSEINPTLLHALWSIENGAAYIGSDGGINVARSDRYYWSRYYQVDL